MFRHTLGLVLFCLLFLAAWAGTPTASPFPLESLINRHLNGYALSQENRFRLALYAELKGVPDPADDSFALDFGGLGSLTFFDRHILLRGERVDAPVLHLNRYEHGTPLAQALDSALHAVFEQIPLLRNGDASRELIRFVDQALARKNLEPFSKIYLRYLLLAHGHYDFVRHEATFHSQDLPAARRPPQPMRVCLQSETLRGFYLHSGGTVYVDNVDRAVRYATGEDYAPHVAAFKVFAHQLFVQTVSYVSQTELARPSGAPPPLGTSPLAPAQPAVKPLYTPYSWIPMMLGILRQQGVNIGDEDVICYFVEADYFERLYAQLLPAEKAKTDAFLARIREGAQR